MFRDAIERANSQTIAATLTVLRLLVATISNFQLAACQIWNPDSELTDYHVIDHPTVFYILRSAIWPQNYNSKYMMSMS